MEDYLELLIFLAFAVFSLLSRFLISRKKPPTRDPNSQPQYEVEDVPESDKPVVAREAPRRSVSQREPSETKPVSFEDILRELMGESPKPEPVSPPPQPVEKAKKKARKVQGELEPAKQAAKKAKRIADKISLEDTGKRIQPTEVTEPTSSLAKEVSNALHNPQNARKAIILSEIINRKYF